METGRVAPSGGELGQPGGAALRGWALEDIRLQGGLESGWSCPLARLERPNGDALELVLAAPGTIDEIRVSDALRYGPIVPCGATNVPLVVDAPQAAAAKAGGQHLQTSEKDLNDSRLKLLSKVPDLQDAAYVLQAADARPAWEGMGGVKMVKDYFGPGQDAVNLEVWGETDEWVSRPSAIYWRLKDIGPGKYYLGLWQETNGFDTRVSEYSQEKIMTRLYVNGQPANFATTSDPVQVKPGLWLAELQSENAVDLKPDDELAVRPQHGWHSDGSFLRLVLYRQAPERGHGVTGRVFGASFGAWRLFPQLRLRPSWRSLAAARRARSMRRESASPTRCPTRLRPWWTGSCPTISARRWSTSRRR